MTYTLRGRGRGAGEKLNTSRDCWYAPPPLPACDDGLDNDGDRTVDLDDDGCDYDSRGTTEGPPPSACTNGCDDDGDGLTDLKDPGCRGKATGTGETDPRAVKPTFRLKAKACARAAGSTPRWSCSRI